MLLVGMMYRGRGWHHAYVRGDRDAALKYSCMPLNCPANIITPLKLLTYQTQHLIRTEQNQQINK